MGLEQIGLLGAVIVLAQAVFKLVEAKLPIFSNGRNGAKNDKLCQALDRLAVNMKEHHGAEIVLLERISLVLQVVSEKMIVHAERSELRAERVKDSLDRIERKQGEKQ